MCVLEAATMTAISIGMTAVSGAMAYVGQQQQYAAQVENIHRQETQAQKTLNLQWSQQKGALESERDKAQAAKADASIAGNAAAGKAIAQSAESGVVGLSVGNLLGSIEGETNRYNGQIDSNARVGTANANAAMKMAQRGGAARLASIPIPTKPSFLPSLVGIASGITGNISDYNKQIKYQPV